MQTNLLLTGPFVPAAPYWVASVFPVIITNCDNYGTNVLQYTC